MKTFVLIGVLIVSLGLAACSGCSLLAGKGDERPFEAQLPVNTQPKRLAIGSGVSVGVKVDGSVWGWGTGLYGELGNGKRSEQRLVPTPIAGMTDFVEVAGHSHFLALHKDGTVWSWGKNDYGQLGYPTEEKFSATPKKIPALKDVVTIAAGWSQSLALDGAGNVYAFGANDSMQLGLAPADNLPHFNVMRVLTHPGAVKLIVGPGRSAVLTKDGEVILFGGDRHDERVAGISLNKPTRLPYSYKVADLAFGIHAIYLLNQDGSVWAKGGNSDGELGQGNRKEYHDYVRVRNIGRITLLSSDGVSAVAVDEAGRVWQWGRNIHHPLIPGESLESIEMLPVLVKRLDGPISVYSSMGNAVLTSDGGVYYWGWNRGGERGTGKRPIDSPNNKEWFVPEKSLWTWK